MRLIRTSAFRFLSICIVLAMCICSFGIQPSAEKVGAHVKEYYKYDYATGERTSYTLSQDILTNDANEDEADVQSDDPRVPGGNSGVVKLVINNGKVGSGFMITLLLRLRIAVFKIIKMYIVILKCFYLQMRQIKHRQRP